MFFTEHDSRLCSFIYHARAALTAPISPAVELSAAEDTSINNKHTHTHIISELTHTLLLNVCFSQCERSSECLMGTHSSFWNVYGSI